MYRCSTSLFLFEFQLYIIIKKNHADSTDVPDSLYPSVLIGPLIAPGDHHTLQHIKEHFGVDFQADFEDVRWHDVAPTWNHTKDHNRSRKLCFHHPGHDPVIRGNPDLHFEGAGNGRVMITRISREHELYSGASPIYIYIYIYIYMTDGQKMNSVSLFNVLISVWISIVYHHQKIMLTAQISPILSPLQSQSSIAPIRGSKLYPVCTELMSVHSCWSASTGVPMCRGLLKNIAHEFIFASQAEPHMSKLNTLCCDKIKGYWMRNNQNGGWKKKANLYNINKI